MPYYGYYGYGVDWGYYAIALVALVIGGAAQAYINSTYRKWSEVPAGIAGTGADVARRMLAEGGARQVGIVGIAGTLTDNYDPRDNQLHLSGANMNGGSVASVAVACHEAGHAIQAACGYAPYRLRRTLVPAVNFAQTSWTLVLLAGAVLNLVGLVQIALGLFAVSVVFQLVTLPVEIDASRRAVRYLDSHGSGLDQKGARAVLTAAALTYVAAALTSVMQLVYLLSRYGGRGNGGHGGRSNR